MFDVAWSELMVVAIVGLVVVAPKDLPRAIRTAVTMVRRARSIQQSVGGGIAALMHDIDEAVHRQMVADVTPRDKAIPDPFAPPSPRTSRQWRHDDSSIVAQTADQAVDLPPSEPAVAGTPDLVAQSRA